MKVTPGERLVTVTSAEAEEAEEATDEAEPADDEAQRKPVKLMKAGRRRNRPRRNENLANITAFC